MTTSELTITRAAAVDTDAWLTDLVRRLTGQEAGAPRAEELDEKRLRSATFIEIISAIEHADQKSASATILLYQRWIDSKPLDSAHLHVAWFNLGVALTEAEDLPNAIIAYQNALCLRPDFHAAVTNLGNVFEAAGNPEKALATWEHGLQPDGERIALFNNRARLLEKIGRLSEAEQELRRSLLTSPNQPDVIQHWVHVRQKMCAWPTLLGDIPGVSTSELLRHAGAMAALAISDDITIQRDAGRDWIQRKTSAAPLALSPPDGYRHDRVRLGYLSSDFCSHAMSYLIAELFERHDRNRFEVYGYCSSPEDGSDIRSRVVKSFDHYRPIKHLSDEQAARLIRDDEIDFLIDLNGLTSGVRPQIIRRKPAPVQATYLGFVGPVPLPELDYMFCDQTVVPPDLAYAYEPKPLYIAHTYQANDTKRIIGAATTRAAVGLPDDAFVFCCFSNHYKMTEEIFTAWMEILRRSDNTIIWLVGDNEWARRNMLERAIQCGVDPGRIVFAARATPDAYMARLRLADLFLDTFPYNAGTIASDAIRMGLPIVTLCGQSFASRMAASLLTALGATQGITTNMQDYVDFAVSLATDKGRYGAYKSRFTLENWQSEIGNIPRFTAQYEEALLSVVKRGASSGKAQESPETELAVVPKAVRTEPVKNAGRLRAVPTQAYSATVLHVGCGTFAREKLPPLFRDAGWREIRLDIDPEVRPDFVASITDMSVIPDDYVDAVYSSHNIEHLYPHEVPQALQEMHRVLKPAGFLYMTLPDLQEVARHVADGKLNDTLYWSAMGPIAPLDILYGYRPALARGNAYMAHHTGFTESTLGGALITAGFVAAMVQRNSYALTAIAFMHTPDKAAQTKAQMQMAAGCPAVLYTSAERPSD